MSRDFQYLASVVLVIFGFFAFRSYAFFMRSLEIYQGMGEEMSALHQLLFNSYRLLPLGLNNDGQGTANPRQRKI